MQMTLLSPPAIEPLSLEEVKDHLRVAGDTDDRQIHELIFVARSLLDGHFGILGRAIVTQTWRLDLDCFPSGIQIRLPLPPLQSVSSVKYYDTFGVLQTMPSSEYHVITGAEPGRVVLKDGYSWPWHAVRPDAVQVTFVAGFGSREAVPAPIRQAMLLLIGDLYENREARVIGAAQVVENETYRALLWPWRYHPLP